MEIKVYNLHGESVGTVTLPERMFCVEPNEALVHEAVVAQMANARAVIAHTKDRGEVRGGGRKPWKQKGTGRARHGSRRSPIWSGGGITFGPNSDREYGVKMNRKARRKALYMVLSDKVANDRFVVVDDLKFDTPKTSVMMKALLALPHADGRTLLVVDPSNTSVRLGARNVQKTETIAPNSLNVVDVLKAHRVVVSKGDLETLVTHFN
ncbi:50S ribosomal protein L4 [Candidatus Uhrbacteria bacterium RIFCSPLOWO2_01_FULL_53_9]|uniref:Large ribosomal subunit protein uL4 n=3 Tax=Candidatus Uhriibacteriota TaxID=1752732 RepID=A0A1F7UXF7_9BACT|nr:MAG: 50S ribosomal protein L4 [Candidatus Uhrbacteria bacterium RIFCSPHIGHO2_02_FULL_53_13]OGL82955.1 MAG: 50S ribosomal protein L4 [Candidatus Uhrbacteria bacterium RIFCSPLOWO2_01_FULL_53_9]OGL90282.1 MAG: 50S ribosomal protein L4 [Candidatus Uhrbacteria bacterium RIFCSPLOWO2_02_FULL_53_10]